MIYALPFDVVDVYYDQQLDELGNPVIVDNDYVYVPRYETRSYPDGVHQIDALAMIDNPGFVSIRSYASLDDLTNDSAMLARGFPLPGDETTDADIWAYLLTTAEFSGATLVA